MRGPLLSLLLALLAPPAHAGLLRPPTVRDTLDQQRILGLPSGTLVRPERLARSLERQPWVTRVVADGDGLRVHLASGAFASVTVELGEEVGGGRRPVTALDAEVAGAPTWRALLAEARPGPAAGLRAGAHGEEVAWPVADGVRVWTTRDAQGLLRPVELDGGRGAFDLSVVDLEVAFSAALGRGDLAAARALVERATAFGPGPVLDMGERWRDRRAELCAAPLVSLSAQATREAGVARRRATRAAVEHALAACRDERGRLLAVATPPLAHLVEGVGSLPGVEGLAGWELLDRGEAAAVEDLDDLARALRVHRGPGLAPFVDGRWRSAPWPARIALLSGLEQSVQTATAQERPDLERQRAWARGELRTQLQAEQARAWGDQRLATAAVLGAALAALEGRSVPTAGGLLDDTPLPTSLRGALLTLAGRQDAADLLARALANHRLPWVGLTMPPAPALLLAPEAHPASLEQGPITSTVEGPLTGRETLHHAWRAPQVVASPAHEAAVAAAARLDEARAWLDVAREPLVPVAPVLLAPGVEVEPVDLVAWRAERLAALEARRAALEALPPTTTRRVTTTVAFQAEVQRWTGTVHRRLRLVLPDGPLEHQPQVDVGAWRYVRHGGNPRVDLPAQDQLTGRAAVEERATATLLAAEADDVAALLVEGIGRLAWSQAQATGGSPADRAREAAALHWLLTGREAPDLQGIGALDGLSPKRAAGVPGRALLVQVSPDGERAVVLRSPFLFEVVAVPDGRRLLGPFEVQGRVSVADGASPDVAFSPDGARVRVADVAVELGTGRILSDEARLAGPWLAAWTRAEVVDAAQVEGRAHLRLRRPLDPSPPRLAPLPAMGDGPWTLDHGLPSPDGDEVAAQLRQPDGRTAVVLVDLPDGNVLARWTEGSPTLGALPDGIAVADALGVRAARWLPRGVAEEPAWLRPAPGGPGALLAHPDGVVEVLDAHAVRYPHEAGEPRVFPVPAHLDPVLLDDGRVLLTRDAERLYLTPVP
ncbi:hypothetical protein L6R53_16180 [Myxococcota bacterium]|nr:hypothetical protein [Myxococcota bacterium]